MSSQDSDGIDGSQQEIDGTFSGSADGGQGTGGIGGGGGGAPLDTGVTIQGSGGTILGTGGIVQENGGATGDASIEGTGGNVPGAGGAIPGSGGAVSGTGGSVPGTGGAASGTGGGTPGSGGAVSGIDGSVPGTGGAVSGTGGSTPGSGGAVSGTGGNVPGSGGAVSGTGGAVSGTGGSVSGTGGAVSGTGGSVSGTGGTVSGTGGSAGSGGSNSVRAILLHHSTGEVIWNGGVASWFQTYNTQHNTDYAIAETYFPKAWPYGWNNYPFDYWNIWVNHAGPSPYTEEPTLEILTQQYEVIIWKHCFPVSDVLADTGTPDITSSRKSVENYKLQYAAVKQKMRQYPSTRFVVWTGAALREVETTVDNATRARDFFQWVTNEWDEPGDNIFVWDFRALETEGGLYLLQSNAQAADAHPNSTFAARVAPLLGKRVVDVIEGRGDSGSLTGQ